MPEKTNNKKILIIIFGTLALITVAVAGAGYWFIKYKAADYFKETQAAAQEARKAGANMSEQACFDRAIALLKGPEGHSISGSIRNNVVLAACLQPSQMVAGFCEGVPEYGNIMSGAMWEIKTCDDLKEEGEFCTRLVREVPKYCGSPARAAKLARAASPPPAPSDQAEKK